MAEGFTTKITFALEGMQKSAEQTTGLLRGMKKMLGLVGVGTAFYLALEPILKPILMMLKAVLLMLFLPLIPLMKPFIASMQSIMKDMLKAQKEAKEGGAGPIGQFGAGLDVLLGSGLGAVGGLLKMFLNLDLEFGEVGESELTNKFVVAGLVGIAGALAVGVASGSPILGYLTGALTFALLSEFLPEFNIEQLKKALMSAGLSALIAGAIVIAFGGGPLVFALVGLIIFGLSMIWDLLQKESIFEKVQSEYIDKFKNDSIKMKGTMDFSGITSNLPTIKDDFGKAFDFSTPARKIDEFTTGIFLPNLKLQKDAVSGPEGVGFAIGSETKGSYPMVWALGKASAKWGTMAKASQTAVSSIITKLAQIPKEIVTIHKIKTVYSSDGGKR